MAKLPLLLATILILVSLSAANTIQDGGFPRGKRTCLQQALGQEFGKCGMYLKPYSRYSVHGCCVELQSVEDVCRCDAIKQMIKQQQQDGRGRYKDPEMKFVMKRATALQGACHIKLPQPCQIPVPVPILF